MSLKNFKLREVCAPIIEYNVINLLALKAELPLKIISLLFTILNDITPFKKDENEMFEKVIYAGKFE